MENIKVRKMASANKVRHWQIAVHLGISEQTLMRWLRTPLSQEREDMIMAAIQAISGEGAV